MKMAAISLNVTKSRILSAQDLLRYRKATDKTLPDSGGQKEYAPSGTWLEKNRLDCVLRERCDLLDEPRVAKFSDLLQGEWDSESGQVKITKPKGKVVQNMGRMVDNIKVIQPNEALFLMETAALEVSFNGVPLSLLEAYSLFLPDSSHLRKYKVYSHLSRHGYTVVPHQGRLDISTLENKTGLKSKNDKQNRKKKTDTKEADKDVKEHSTLTSENIPCQSSSEKLPNSTFEQSNPDPFKTKLSQSLEISKTNSVNQLFEETDELMIESPSQEMSNQMEEFYQSIQESSNFSSAGQETASFSSWGLKPEFPTVQVPFSKTDVDLSEKKHVQLSPLHEDVIFPNFAGKDFILLTKLPEELLPENVKPAKELYKLSKNVLLCSDNIRPNQYNRRNYFTHYRGAKFGNQRMAPNRNEQRTIVAKTLVVSNYSRNSNVREFPEAVACQDIINLCSPQCEYDSETKVEDMGPNSNDSVKKLEASNTFDPQVVPNSDSSVYIKTQGGDVLGFIDRKKPKPETSYQTQSPSNYFSRDKTYHDKPKKGSQDNRSLPTEFPNQTLASHKESHFQESLGQPPSTSFQSQDCRNYNREMQYSNSRTNYKDSRLENVNFGTKDYFNKSPSSNVEIQNDLSVFNRPDSDVRSYNSEFHQRNEPRSLFPNYSESKSVPTFNSPTFQSQDSRDFDHNRSKNPRWDPRTSKSQQPIQRHQHNFDRRPSRNPRDSKIQNTGSNDDNSNTRSRTQLSNTREFDNNYFQKRNYDQHQNVTWTPSSSRIDSPKYVIERTFSKTPSSNESQFKNQSIRDNSHNSKPNWLNPNAKPFEPQFSTSKQDIGPQRQDTRHLLKSNSPSTGRDTRSWSERRESDCFIKSPNQSSASKAGQPQTELPTNTFNEGHSKPNCSRWDAGGVSRIPPKRPRREDRQGGPEYPSAVPKLQVPVNCWSQFKRVLSSLNNMQDQGMGLERTLYTGQVHPLVKCHLKTDIVDVMSKLKIIPQVNLTLCDDNSRIPIFTEDQDNIHFDVYLPTAPYKLSNPTLPNLRVVVVNQTDPVPSLHLVAYLQRQLCDGVPLYFAVVGDDGLAFYGMHDVKLPQLNTVLTCT